MIDGLKQFYSSAVSKEVRVVKNQAEVLTTPLAEDLLLIAEDTHQHYLPDVNPAPDTSGYTSQSNIGLINGYDICMSPNGQKVLVTRYNEGATIYEYNLTVPGRLSQGVSGTANLPSTLPGNNRHMQFSGDGTKLYMSSNLTDILDVSLTTTGSIAGGFSSNSSTNMTAYTGGTPFHGFDYNSDKTKLIVAGNGVIAYEWTLATPGNILSVSSSKAITLPGLTNLRNVGYLDDNTIVVIGTDRQLRQYNITNRDSAVQMGSAYTGSTSGPGTSGSSGTLGMFVSREDGLLFLTNYSTGGMFQYTVMTKAWRGYLGDLAFKDESQLIPDASVFTVHNAATTLSTENQVALDSASGAFTINLPAAPANMRRFRFIELSGTAPTNVITVSGNGNSIRNTSGVDDTSININSRFADIEIIYVASLSRWIILDK